jgi:DNA-directed RNA polymerase subunit delta
VKRIVKDYDALPEEILHAVKIKYPTGYESHLVSYTNAEGRAVSALPFATSDIYYLIRMTVAEARQIVRDDEDFDDEGILRAEVADEPEVDTEYGGNDEDVEDIADTSSNDDDDDEDHIIPTRRRGRDDDDGYDDDY